MTSSLFFASFSFACLFSILLGSFRSHHQPECQFFRPAFLLLLLLLLLILPLLPLHHHHHQHQQHLLLFLHAHIIRINYVGSFSCILILSFLLLFYLLFLLLISRYLFLDIYDIPFLIPLSHYLFFDIAFLKSSILFS